MLTSPCTVREISRSSLLAEQGRRIAFLDRPLEKSGAEPLTPRHTWLNCRSAALLAAIALVAVTAFAPGAARAQDTWRPTPASNDFNTAINWSPVGVPTGTAFFGQSDITELTFSESTTVGGWIFNTGASDYTFSNNQTLQFNDAGIVLIGGSATINNNLFLNFLDGSTAGSATINNSGTVTFLGDTNAGNASIVNNGTLVFDGRSTASNAAITNNGGEVRFIVNSTGGNATITNANGSVVDFSGSTGPAGDNKLTAGSIAGAGSFELGRNELTVGGNNLSTDVSGDISGILGSLVKVGTGTLTLSGSANLGGTTIDGGTLAVNGGTLNASDTIVMGSTAGSSGTLNIGAGGVARTLNIIVGQSGVGTLAVQNGGTLTDFGGFVGDSPGSQGTATVSGASSTWTNTGTLQVGGLGTGTLTIENGGTVNSGGGGSIGLSAGSTGTVTVTGPGSIWNNNSPGGGNPGGGLNIGSFGTGTLTIANGGRVIDITPFVTNIGNGAGSHGTVTVTGAGSLWSDIAGFRIGNSGTGTLAVVDGGIVSAPIVTIAANAGSTGTLNIGAGAGTPAAAPGTLTTRSVAFGDGTGTINFNHTSTDYVFAPAISGNGTVNVLAGTTILTGTNSYSGATNVDAGTLRAGALNTFSPNSAVMVASGGTLDLNGFNQTLSGLTNAGLVNMGTGTAPGTVLTTTSYAGTGGTMAINTLLGGSGSPSDRLVISGGVGTGTTTMHVTNAGGSGAETTGNGIQVVEAINGATTSASAFALPAGELRAGAFDYDLFHGGVGGSPNDWFLRSDFIAGGAGGGGVPTTPLPPVTSLPLDPPPNPLPPGVAFPIIGRELATYGVVQPLARQLGLSILGTLDDRVGDTYEPDGCAVASAPETSSVDLPTKKPAAVPTKKPGPAPCPLFSPSVWGRFFGQTIHNNYQAFAAPSASGDLGGFQGGIDLLRGSLIAGHYERAGLYGAYGDVNADVDGLVTNPAATAYVLTHTGSMNLDSWSAGGYWTHTGPGGWYLDAVLQGTWYYGSASTQFARLNTDGTGFIGSLEGGYPYAWPQLGPGFVIEPEGQILWQKVSFRHDYDGLGDVALGDTTGPSGRIGLRTKWTIVTGGGQVWQPYLRGNLWRDWGAQANTTFSGTDLVPLASQVTRLELGGGVTGRINANVSVFANVDYEFAVGAGENEKRNGVRGAFGAKYAW
jgi:outer membrane autotransporter protein